MEQAIEIIKEQMKEEQYKSLGEYVLKAIETNKVAVEGIIKKEKTLKGCFNECKKVASKKKTNNFYYMPPEETYKITREYFGITAIQEEISVLDPMQKETPKEETKEEKQKLKDKMEKSDTEEAFSRELKRINEDFTNILIVLSRMTKEDKETYTKGAIKLLDIMKSKL